jgi:hypothetical protein
MNDVLTAEKLLRAERDSIAERIGLLNQELSKYPLICHEVVELQMRYKILSEAINMKEDEDESPA